MTPANLEKNSGKMCERQDLNHGGVASRWTVPPLDRKTGVFPVDLRHSSNGLLVRVEFGELELGAEDVFRSATYQVETNLSMQTVETPI
jgi:hypothetical protein